jgi:hypothetical protein
MFSTIPIFRSRIPTKMHTCAIRLWTAVPGDDGHLFQSIVVGGASRDIIYSVGLAMQF